MIVAEAATITSHFDQSLPLHLQGAIRGNRASGRPMLVQTILVQLWLSGAAATAAVGFVLAIILFA
jgi:hypothetical protein